jgi:glycine C-acetyltransferase
MLSEDVENFYLKQIENLRENGFYKQERRLFTPQANRVKAGFDGGSVKPYINLCANNYLGLANDERLINKAKTSLDEQGFGMASVRFICGTNDIHASLEGEISSFLKKGACVLFPSCFDANAGIFEVLLDEGDAVISDQLNHASIIDGIRLCKAKRYRYQNNNMCELEQKLQEASAIANKILIVSDGVFSMDGVIANLPAIADLADKYSAMVMVDDSHAIGVLGDDGGGSVSYYNIHDRIDIISGTLGKALGGASGGYIAANNYIVDLLKQKARPYLFSNSLMPAIASASMESLKILRGDPARLKRLHANSVMMRKGLEKIGFSLLGANHPIIPILLHDEKLALKFADILQENGVYAIAFAFPVVPKNMARIRLQMSSELTIDDITHSLAIFEKIASDLDIL